MRLFKIPIVREILWLSLIFTVVAVARLPKTTFRECDEVVEYTVAQDVSHGGIPYKTSYDHKGPFLFYLYAPVFKLFGPNILAPRLFTAFHLSVAMLFMYLTGRALFPGRLRLLPPAIYGLYSISPNLFMFESPADLTMMLPITVAAFFFFKYFLPDKHEPKYMFLCGVMVSIGFFIKGSCGATSLAFPIALLLDRVIRKEYGWKRLLSEYSILAAGFLVPTALLFIFYYFNGALKELIEGYFLYHTKYIAATSNQEASTNLAYLIKHFINYNPIVVASFFSFILILASGKNFLKQKTTLTVLSLTVMSVLGIALSGRWSANYTAQMGLGFSLLIPLGLTSLATNEAVLNRIARTGVIAGLVLWFPFADIDKTFSRDPRSINNDKIAEYIRANTTRDDTIFVFGGDPVIQLLADRKAPLKYFWYLIYVSNRKGLLGLSNETILKAFDEHKPKIVVSHVGVIEKTNPRNPAFFLGDYIRRNYVPKFKLGAYIISTPK
ncbi:MAG: glycosyltransferase family 39 protein [Candidatus Omnitrophica bacterium]|nr:glycosyltransferase family 39 protein [Candidatus Omnitrophota bacterium]